jgi:hypothetical protein
MILLEIVGPAAARTSGQRARNIIGKGAQRTHPDAATVQLFADEALAPRPKIFAFRVRDRKFLRLSSRVGPDWSDRNHRTLSRQQPRTPQ